MAQHYILLDIDGVMITAASWRPVLVETDGFYSFGKQAQKQLDALLEKTAAHIILTSTHRSRFSNEGWEKIFSERCPHFKSVQVIDDFKLPARKNDRLSEVMHWALLHGKDASYVIIDDDTSLDALPPEIRAHWVRTSPLIGFNEECLERALGVLNEGSEGLH